MWLPTPHPHKYTWFPLLLNVVLNPDWPLGNSGLGLHHASDSLETWESFPRRLAFTREAVYPNKRNRYHIQVVKSTVGEEALCCFPPGGARVCPEKCPNYSHSSRTSCEPGNLWQSSGAFPLWSLSHQHWGLELPASERLELAGSSPRSGGSVVQGLLLESPGVLWTSSP